MSLNSPVCVTGGSGFLGSWCVAKLLEKGYFVHTTVRSLEKANHLMKLANAESNLKVFVADLLSPGSFDSAFSGCKAVLHVASPLALENHTEDYFVKPAVAGAKRALKFAKKHGVKKVVLTSSVAAIFETGEEKVFYDESDWSDPDNPNISNYAKSKTLAEKAAWEFLKEEGDPFDFAVINPALVIGPSLSGDLGVSNSAIEMVVTGKMPLAIPIQFGFVDVRDVATAHILAMQTDASNGERFALAERDLWYKDIAKILKDNGFDKAPKIAVPVWVAKILGNFNKQLKVASPFLGRVRSVVKATKAKDILGWKPRSSEESIIEIANQIKEMGLIK